MRKHKRCPERNAYYMAIAQTMLCIGCVPVLFYIVAAPYDMQFPRLTTDAGLSGACMIIIVMLCCAMSVMNLVKARSELDKAERDWDDEERLQ